MVTHDSKSDLPLIKKRREISMIQLSTGKNVSGLENRNSPPENTFPAKEIPFLRQKKIDTRNKSKLCFVLITLITA